MRRRPIALAVAAVLVLGFLLWRFLRPMNIFVVGERFAWPVDTRDAPAALAELRARDCGACHGAFRAEWQTSMHSRAWTDPYFQADWSFDRRQYICRLCHTPLDRQQPGRVLGYRDASRWLPILGDNPGFDPALQHEGVTCAACHYRQGAIVGVLGTTSAPHPVRRIEDPNLVCVRCHVVDGDRWDTFYRFPPCGTVAEIRSAPRGGSTGEITASDARSLGCVQCHMPAVRRPLVDAGVERNTRRHLWRGGHDVEMVRRALGVQFAELAASSRGRRRVRLTITNTGAAHYVPTGTPDRHLTVRLRLMDRDDRVLASARHTLRRWVMWRPFIVDLWDTRLAPGAPRRYELEVPAKGGAVWAEAEVRYHLLTDRRRRRIGYRNETPIDYEVVRLRIPLGEEREGGKP